jgi:hypothetical protein
MNATPTCIRRIRTSDHDSGYGEYDAYGVYSGYTADMAVTTLSMMIISMVKHLHLHPSPVWKCHSRKSFLFLSR